MKHTHFEFAFLDKKYPGEVEYFEPPTVMPYYMVTISDPGLTAQFGAIHNFKEEEEKGFIVLKPALEPQGKYHSYFWTCLMVEIYILLLNEQS